MVGVQAIEAGLNTPVPFKKTKSPVTDTKSGPASTAGEGNNETFTV